MPENKKTIMSGMRPTGKLHIGHYMGVLKNWVELQNDYNCYYAIADWHALTTKYEETEELNQHIIEVATDWLASGINPQESIIYVQSLIPQIAELHVYLSMITPYNWVERDPALKDMVQILSKKTDEQEAKDPTASGVITYGLLGYPVLQSADIMIFNASLVPVGKDQVAHLELSRDIARKFNNIYKTDYFNEPQPKLTTAPLLKGIDGQKMGKSFNNDIKLSDSDEITAKKIMRAITDRSRIKRTDPGHPDECEVVYTYYSIFADETTQNIVRKECSAGTRGCKDCKIELANLINNYFKNIREKRKELEQDTDYIKQVIFEGSKKAKQRAAEVLYEVKDIMNLYKV